MNSGITLKSAMSHCMILDGTICITFCVNATLWSCAAHLSCCMLSLGEREDLESPAWGYI